MTTMTSKTGISKEAHPDSEIEMWERTRLACPFGRPAQMFAAHFFGRLGEKRFWGRSFRRVAENHTPAAYALIAANQRKAMPKAINNKPVPKRFWQQGRRTRPDQSNQCRQRRHSMSAEAKPCGEWGRRSSRKGTAVESAAAPNKVGQNNRLPLTQTITSRTSMIAMPPPRAVRRE